MWGEFSENGNKMVVRNSEKKRQNETLFFFILEALENGDMV